MTLKRFLPTVVSTAALVGSLVLGSPVHASTALENAAVGLNTAGEGLGSANTATNPAALVRDLINVLLSVLGILLFLYFFYAGFLWMTAGGEAEKIKKAKNILVNSTIGLAIILSAYIISGFVLNALIGATVAQ